MINGMFMRAMMSLVVVTISLSSIQSQARSLDPLPPTEINQRLNDFQYEPWNGSASDSDKNGGGCRETKMKLEIRDPVLQDARSVVVSVMRPSAKAPVPVVLVVPSMEGVTVVEPKIASQLCHAGIGAVIADVIDTSLPTTLPAVGHEDAQERKAVLALRTLLDVVSSHPAFDRDRVGIIGVSVGGIVTSLMAGIEPDRLKAVVIVVGGGNIPYILSNSNNKKVAELRRQRMEYLHLATNEQYEDWLRLNMRYDPLYFAARANRDRIMMITARGDVTVPYSMQKDLFEAFGQPTVSEYSGGHVETILSMTYFYFGDVINFYKSRLGMSSFSVPEVTFR